MIRTSLVSALFVWAATGCGGGGDGEMPDGSPDAPAPMDAMVSPDAASLPDIPFMPQTLSATGLYEDIANDIVSPLVRPFQPAGELWSDEAAKRRWVYLPPGATIDTSNMDYWVLPRGTRLWKEFTVDGVRVETRLLYKTGPAEWFMMAYIWNDDESEAEAAPYGRLNARGTDHDVPRQVDCEKCHEGVPDRALGFSALQLDHARGGLSLADLVSQGVLSNPPAGSGVPYFPLPGGPVDHAALRYLHANCGGCHNPRTYVDSVSVSLRLDVGQLGAVESTPVYTSTVGVSSTSRTPPPGSTAIIEPGNPDTSALYMRMNARLDLYAMPPLGTKEVDAEGLSAIRSWIESMPQAAGIRAKVDADACGPHQACSNEPIGQ